MAHKVSDQHREEIQKILKYLKNMEGIIRTSSNPEQKARVQKELAKQRARLAAIVPGLDATRMNATQITAELEMGASSADSTGAGAGAAATAPASSGGRRGAGGAAGTVLGKFPIDKASPHSSDPDVN